MPRKLRILITIILLTGQVSLAQKIDRPKELKVQGTYTHTPTMTEFPENIGEFRRQGVYLFDKKKENIGSTYKYKSDQGETTLSLYIYPAGAGSEGRLRNEYFNVLQDIANVYNKEIGADQYFKDFKNGIYKINGYSAFIAGDTKSQLTVFECGEWFLKIRITTDLLDTAGINSLEKETLRTIDPTRIAKNDPLDIRGKVYVAPAAFRDSLMLSSAISGALEKLIWAKQNVDSLERTSGFPDIYLELHINSWLKFSEFQKTKKYKSIPQNTQNYLSQLNEIINAGFLEEFIMEQFNMVMVVPKDMILDFDSFNKWKVGNPIKIDLSEKWYLVSYEVKN